jgi:quinolinate synthase
MAIEAKSVQETYLKMSRLLARLLPDFEIRLKAELAYEINRLKKEKGALILGHNYMEPALFHSVCDVVGDSLELSRKAATTTSDPIIFCGVRFMAETAKILNPERTVLLPAKKAGCSLASSISAQDIRALRARYPGVPIVTYINTYADVKAECDICCTSGNAVKVVNSLQSEVVIFVPDEFLAKNVAAETGKTIIFSGESSTKSDQPVMIGWKGRCEVHDRFTVEDIENARKQFPGVVVLAHPECSPEVVSKSDFSQSTTRMAEFVKNSDAPHFLLLTECSMGDNIIAENSQKDILRMCNIRCPHMNEITLEDTLNALTNNEQVIEVEESVRVRARRSLERMLEVS